MKNSLGIYRVFLCKKCHCWHCIQNASISEPLITNKERNQTHTHTNRHTTRTTVDATRLSIVFWTVLLFMNEKTNSNYTWRSDGKSLLQTITICLKRKEATERERAKRKISSNGSGDDRSHELSTKKMVWNDFSLDTFVFSRIRTPLKTLSVNIFLKSIDFHRKTFNYNNRKLIQQPTPNEKSQN